VILELDGGKNIIDWFDRGFSELQLIDELDTETGYFWGRVIGDLSDLETITADWGSGSTTEPS
jgi:hypothetical protein